MIEKENNRGNIGPTFRKWAVIAGIAALVCNKYCFDRLSGYFQVLGSTLIAVIMPVYIKRIKLKNKIMKNFTIVSAILVLFLGGILCYNYQNSYWIETVFGLSVSFLFAVAQHIDDNEKTG